MKKMLSIGCAIVLCLSIASCGATRDSAETVVENAIKAFQSGDQATMQAYWGEEDSSGSTSEEDVQAQEMVKLLSQDLTYKIIDSEENEDSGTATVSVEFTNINMSEVFSIFMGEMFSAAFGYAFLPEDQQPSDEEMNQMYMDKFAEVVEENKDNIVTTEVDIPLTLVDNEWKINATEDVIDAMLGGLYSSANSMSEAFAE
ncbi:nuclear transport factor 2 family protein [Emergencia timonensis]